MAGFDVCAAERDMTQALPRYLDELALLVDIDSPTENKDGNDRIIRHLAERYASLNAQIEIVPQSSCGDFLRASWEGDGRGSVLLLGHTDTVYPTGTVGRWPFRREGDRAYGPGVADMKSGDLSIAHAIERVLACGSRFRHLEVLHNTDEEIGSPFSRELVRARAREADAVLVLEAGREDGSVVSARKGIASFEIDVVGRAAHAGVNHSHGRSAALELAHLVIAIEGINGTVPTVTVNIGALHVEGRPNVIPDQARAVGEVRAAEREHLDTALSRLEALVQRPTVDGVCATLRTLVAHEPMARSAGTEWLLGLAGAAARDLGFELRDTATGGASDGNTAATLGRPVLDGLGPIGGAAHSSNEYLIVPSIAARVALLAALIDAVGADGPPESV